MTEQQLRTIQRFTKNTSYFTVRRPPNYATDGIIELVLHDPTGPIEMLDIAPNGEVCQ